MKRSPEIDYGFKRPPLPTAPVITRKPKAKKAAKSPTHQKPERDLVLKEIRAVTSELRDLAESVREIADAKEGVALLAYSIDEMRHAMLTIAEGMRNMPNVYAPIVECAKSGAEDAARATFAVAASARSMSGVINNINDTNKNTAEILKKLTDAIELWFARSAVASQQAQGE